jgi:hypothetical protein
MSIRDRPCSARTGAATSGTASVVLPSENTHKNVIRLRDGQGQDLLGDGPAWTRPSVARWRLWLTIVKSQIPAPTVQLISSSCRPSGCFYLSLELTPPGNVHDIAQGTVGSPVGAGCFAPDEGVVLPIMHFSRGGCALGGPNRGHCSPCSTLSIIICTRII